jgi:hypothetical protein
MRIRRIVSTLLLLGIAPLAADEPFPAGLHKGMPAQDVRQRLGPPVRIVRQVLYRRHIEQWVYENPLPIRVQISCVRGDEPIVTGVLRAETTPSFRKG